MKKYLMIFLVLLMAVSFTSVFADDLADVKSSGVIRIGTMQEYIPFVFTGSDGNLDGMDIALMNEVGRRMGVRVEPVSMAFDGLIDALELGQIDMIGGAFAKTAEREARIDFSRVYYTADSEFIALSSLPKPGTITLDSFRDMKIGVQKGTSFDQWVKTNLVTPGYVSTRNVYTYSSAADEMKALDRKDVDLVVLSQDIYEDLYEKTGKYQIYYDNFMKESYAFGLRKGSTLTNAINEQLVAMMKDGTAQNIANRYFAMDYSEASAGISRQSAIATPTPAIPVVVVPTQAPNTNCKNGMTFVSDVTITDGHQVSRNEKFRKVWRVRNSGTCQWTPNYTFVFVSGDQMSGRNINVPTYVQPGQTVDLAVDFTAPNSDGTYRSNWQMRSPQGQNFGETIWCKVRVNGGGSGNAPVISSFYPDFYSGTRDVCPTVYWKTGNTAMVDIRVDGTSVAKSYSSNGSQRICGSLQSLGSHTVELAASNSSNTTYSSFTYTTKKGEEGQHQIIPVINYFYPNANSGVSGGCPTVYWSVSNSGAVDVSVDGSNYDRSYDATGAMVVCGALQNPGTHTVTLTAHSVTDDRTSSFSYVTNGDDGQHGDPPGINYFYVSPDSGTMGDSTTAYWSVSGASMVYVTVDGNSIYSGSDNTGSAPIQATIQNVGTHSITLTARNVISDTTQTVYYTMYNGGGGGGGGGDDGQTRVIPSIDYFYVSPDSGTMGDSTTAYWGVSNAGGVTITVDGNTIYNGSDSSGSAPISATIQSVGTHSITLTAHSVTDDASSTVYYTMEGQTGFDPDQGGGWAGSNYYENEGYDDGGFAGSNYSEGESYDEGGYAGSGYEDYDGSSDDDYYSGDYSEEDLNALYDLFTGEGLW